jgi:hypothetical protein
MRTGTALCALFTVIALVCGPLAALADDAVGMVKVSKGAATIERTGQRLSAAPGTKVREGDVVVTGADGSIGITFSDDTLLSLGPGSRLTIDRFAFDQTTHRGAFESSLQRGTLAGVSGKIAKQTPDAMKVHTPAAVLGVRGTEFVLRTGEPGR